MDKINIYIPLTWRMAFLRWSHVYEFKQNCLEGHFYKGNAGIF